MPGAVGAAYRLLTLSVLAQIAVGEPASGMDPLLVPSSTKPSYALSYPHRARRYHRLRTHGHEFGYRRAYWTGYPGRVAGLYWPYGHSFPDRPTYGHYIRKWPRWTIGYSEDNARRGDPIHAATRRGNMDSSKMRPAQERSRTGATPGASEGWNLAVVQADALAAFRRQRKAEAAMPAPTTPQLSASEVVQIEADAKRVAAALHRGDKAFAEGEYDSARVEYVRALVLAENEPGVRIALGLAEYALGNYIDASSAIRRGVADSPALARSEFDLAKVYGRPEDLSAHRQALADFQKKNPEDAGALFLLGFVRFFSGQREEGIATLQSYRDHAKHDPAAERFLEGALAPDPRRKPVE